MEVIVYEENHILLTDRFVRDAVSQTIYPPLAPGEAAAFLLETNDLNGVDWSKIRVVALADFRPAGDDDAYAMLQAATPSPHSFRILNTELLFMVDSSQPSGATMPLFFRGPGHLIWTVNENLPWVEVLPLSAPLLEMPDVTINPQNLTSGWQQGVISFTASGDGATYTDEVSVRVYFGPVTKMYVPIISH